MTSKLCGFVLTVSRCRPPHAFARALRRMHQAVARSPQLQPPHVQNVSNEYLHALYQDLMSLEPATIGPKHLQVADTQFGLDGLLAEHAKQGNVADFESLMSSYVSGPPTEQQRDLHVKAHIMDASLSTQGFPTGALAVLHQYEASGQFAPVKSYTRVISTLFNVQTSTLSEPQLGRSAAQAQAWDLFAHMRYVAHPVPDAHLYALMIRACGSFSRPEPERALDLWTEMQENGVEPTRGAYEAIIKVCGRAGQEWLGEGTRLAREMSERFSISGMDGRGLWCALLEGCKRAGDLKKARWILAEAVRGEDSVVDAELMTHVFHSYASYRPPFRRESTRLVDVDAENETGGESVEEMPVPTDNEPSFSRLPPQTSSDVVAETRALFDRITQDRCKTSEGMLAGRFARVEPTPVLLNAYLSVFYRHASIETSQRIFGTVFDDGHRTDEYTYINALECCAVARAEDRQVAARWAGEIWRRWEEVEAKGVRDGKKDVGTFARLIEKAHAAMRRVLILSGDLDGALSLLRTFIAQYPPNDVSPTSIRLFAKPPILSTRTALCSPGRPLVRLTSAASPRDDRVPPMIAFSDVELLHARLVEHGRTKEVGYVKWVCMTYGGAVRRRRLVSTGISE